jgi:hypothetical protein
VVAVVRELMSASRIEAAVTAAGGQLRRFDAPDALPPPTVVDLLVVDWADRQPGWAEAITTWRASAAGQAPRVVLFGPHTDLDAHAAAREAGLGPMRARSAFFTSLPALLGGTTPET